MRRQFNDAEDDLSLPTRRSEAAGFGQGHAQDTEPPGHDREVTLNTGIVLAIFFALALVCAVFFGFGYSIGHKSVVSAVPASDASSDSGASDASVPPSPNPKPAAGSAATQSIPGYQPQGTSTEKTTAVPSTPRTPVQTVETQPATDESAPPPTKSVPLTRTPAVSALAPSQGETTHPSIASPETSPSTYVQIAAVSHQEDADVLLSTLKRRGYKVIQRSEPADHLIHVQIGPFATRKDAEAIKQKLLADGYNAFIK